MNRKSFLMLAAATVLGAGVAGVAMAQPGGGPRGGHGGGHGGPGGMSPIYDVTQLPEIKGTVKQYSLSPRGEIVGLILADGTEVYLPPFVSTQLAFAVKPGDAVTIHGLRAKALPLVAARAVTNDATGAKVLVSGPRGGRGGGPTIEAQGPVAAALHSPNGEVNGVRLEDGTQVRMPPGEAKRLAEMLAPGKTVVVRGEGYAGPLGKSLVAMQIGPDAANLAPVARPRLGDGRGKQFREMREMRHGRHHGEDGMRGHQPG
jgi:hypothetical protein